MTEQTSLQAFEKIKPEITKLHLQILKKMNPDDDYIRSELCNITGIRESTMCARLHELEDKGLIFVCGNRSNTRGRKCKTYKKMLLVGE